MLGLETEKPEEVLSALRSKCNEIRDLVRSQYPPALIGYFWNMMFLQLFSKAEEAADEIGLVAGPDEQVLIFAMEYIHAVIASDGLDTPDFANVDAEVGDKPGEADKFFDESQFSGTPFKTLPARIKPLIEVGDEYYCTEPNFIRDASYRAIQRAIIPTPPIGTICCLRSYRRAELAYWRQFSPEHGWRGSNAVPRTL